MPYFKQTHIFLSSLLMLCVGTAIVSAEGEVAELAAKSESEFDRTVKNWQSFSEALAKAEATTVYAQTIKAKIDELLAPCLAHVAKAKSEEDKSQVVALAKALAPEVNIWNEEFERTKIYQQVLLEVQKCGDADLAADLNGVMEKSIRLREIKLEMLATEKSHSDLISRTYRQAKKLNDKEATIAKQAALIKKIQEKHPEILEELQKKVK